MANAKLKTLPISNHQVKATKELRHLRLQRYNNCAPHLCRDQNVNSALACSRIDASTNVHDNNSVSSQGTAQSSIRLRIKDYIYTYAHVAAVVCTLLKEPGAAQHGTGRYDISTNECHDSEHPPWLDCSTLTSVFLPLTSICRR